MCIRDRVLVNDGSSDDSAEVIRKLSFEIPELVGVLLRKNYGQTAAMAAGFDISSGEIVVTLDGDLQNDPADIPLLVNKIRDGFDLVSGWRYRRQDAAISRKLPSKIANRLIGKVTGVRLNDYGCSLKAYRKEVLRDMRLYGELHRFLPVLANIEGARITEVKVNHRARQFGSSKYGIDRTFRVLMDLLTVWFMNRFLTRPMYVFGFGFAVAGGAMSTVDRLQEGQTVKQAVVGGIAEAGGSWLGFGAGMKLGTAVTGKIALPLLTIPKAGWVAYPLVVLAGGIASILISGILISGMSIT